MKVNELSSYLENKIPIALSEPWDNDGRMVVPNGEAEVTGVLVALDCTSKAIERAAELGCNVIVTHHPLVFKPLANLTDGDNVGKRVLNCVQNGIAVLSYHTRLDSMEGGVNDCLADAIGLKRRARFCLTAESATWMRRALKRLQSMFLARWACKIPRWSRQVTRWSAWRSFRAVARTRSQR